MGRGFKWDTRLSLKWFFRCLRDLSVGADAVHVVVRIAAQLRRAVRMISTINIKSQTNLLCNVPMCFGIVEGVSSNYVELECL